MREILFKAKAINRDIGYHRSNYKNGDWVYGLVTKLYDNRFENLPAKMTDLNGVSGIEIDHDTICQYTGLTDKNGNKIWENDIVRKVDVNALGYHRERICTVSFDRFGYWKVMTTLGDGYWIGNFDEEQLEVIGNKFDNPELLEGERKE